MICISLQNKTCAQILEILSDPSVEMAEIRLDRCPLSEEEIEELFSQSDTPLIATCRLAECLGARLALLKARSPSCGKGIIYDGSFQGRLHPGNGVTAKALAELGVRIYTEEEIDMLLYDLEEMCHDTL